VSISRTGNIGGNVEELLSGMEEEVGLKKLRMDDCCGILSFFDKKCVE
jgi:hypothetical protein